MKKQIANGHMIVVFFFFLHQKDVDYGEKAPHWNARKGGDKHIDSGILSESVSGSQYSTEQP